MVPLLRNHFHTPVSVRFPFFYVVTTPQNGGLQQLCNDVRVSNISCDNPSKWGIQQLNTAIPAMIPGCDNPSKWGLQQRPP